MIKIPIYFQRRDKFLACLHSILSMSHAQLTSDDTALLKLFKKTLGRTSLVKMNDQRLLTEMKEVFILISIRVET